jgi:PRTRC genetic system protein A
MFVNHIVANNPYLPRMGPFLYTYILAANGIFVRARRPELAALIWVASVREPVRGLYEVHPYVGMDCRVPVLQVARMFEMAYRADGKEILFYLSANPWRIQVPEQVQRGASVHPVDPYAGGANTIIEVHSHHGMKAFFSEEDDREEQTGFRIYAVLGDLYNRPAIRVRVGIYGHFWEIPADWVFELPQGVKDGLYEGIEYEHTR